MDHYDIRRLNAFDEWVNGAYDERGNSAICDLCGGEMKWNPVMCHWYCIECEQTMDRKTYFNHIGAMPPGLFCVDQCEENYPFCKKYCEHFIIDSKDPILD